MLDWHCHCVAVRRCGTAKDLERQLTHATYTQIQSSRDDGTCVYADARRQMNSISLRGMKRQRPRHLESSQLTLRTSLSNHYTQVSVISPSIWGGCLEQTLGCVPCTAEFTLTFKIVIIISSFMLGTLSLLVSVEPGSFVWPIHVASLPLRQISAWPHPGLGNHNCSIWFVRVWCDDW